jgi:hypothetical protein
MVTPDNVCQIVVRHDERLGSVEDDLTGVKDTLKGLSSKFDKMVWYAMVTAVGAVGTLLVMLFNTFARKAG